MVRVAAKLAEVRAGWNESLIMCADLRAERDRLGIEVERLRMLKHELTRAFSTAAKETEQAEAKLAEWEAGAHADETGHLHRCAKVNGVWSCADGCVVAKLAQVVEGSRDADALLTDAEATLLALASVSRKIDYSRLVGNLSNILKRTRAALAAVKENEPRKEPVVHVCKGCTVCDLPHLHALAAAQPASPEKKS
jgi:hypothetical protein